jgi:hypothetical protein
MFRIIAEKKSDTCIIYEDKPVIQYAAEQLQCYLQKISNCVLSISEIGENVIYLGSPNWVLENTGITVMGLKHDGYMIKTEKNRLILSSSFDRGVLFGVYALLEDIGCRWFYPGNDGEYIPHLDDISIDLNLITNPDYSLRNFTYDGCKGTDEWVKELTETIDWCAKVGANAFFIHGSPYGEGIYGLDKLATEIKRRGLMLEIGGHGVHHLVDRSLFEQKPELFREVKGKRKTDGNFCASNPEAVQMAVSGVHKLFDKYKDIDVLHLWFDDVMGGSWCECEKCKDIPTQQQQLSVVNTIAKEVANINCNAKVDMLLYHDTLDMDAVNIKPEENVYAYFAPRERCRMHSIGDENCNKNQRQYDSLKGAKKRFGNNTYIFEYYADMILFRQLAIHSPELIAKDLKDYISAGVDKISCLMFGKYSWWAYPFNMYAFAKLSWNIDWDYSYGVKEYSRLMFANQADAIEQYLALIERASGMMQAFCEYGDNIDDLRNIPPQAPEFNKWHIELIGEAVDLYKKAEKLIDDVLSSVDASLKDRLIKEKYLIAYTIPEAEAIYCQMMGRYLYFISGQADKKALEYWMDKAIEYRVDLAEQYEKNISKVLCGVNDFHGCRDMSDWNKNMREHG